MEAARPLTAVWFVAALIVDRRGPLVGALATPAQNGPTIQTKTMRPVA